MSATTAGKHLYIIPYYDEYLKMTVVLFVNQYYNPKLLEEYLEACEELFEDEDKSGAW